MFHPLKVHKIIGFTPELLKIVMTAEVPQPIRQAGLYTSYIISERFIPHQRSVKHILLSIFAGAIYLKNEVQKYWPPPLEEETKAGGELEFSIHEQDKGIIRSQIIEAMVQAPEIIRLPT